MRITRRTMLAGLGTLAAAPFITHKFLRGRQTKKPNLVLFLADDMSYDTTGYLGNPIIQTPQLDRLSKESFIFNNSFVTTSICPCSRATIYSGEYALRHGVGNFASPMRPASFNNNFFRHMRGHGYHTGFVGKWGIGNSVPDRHFDYFRGFAGQGDYFNGNHQHITDVQTQQAVEFLNSVPADKPFLLIVAYKAPHGPFIPQKRFEGLYKDVQFPRPKSDTYEHYMDLPPILKNPNHPKKYTPRDNESYSNSLRMYYQTISGMDDSIGQVLAHIDICGMNDTTNVVFTSDNGFLLGAHGLWGKWYMFEESIRVPLLIRPAPYFYNDLHGRHVRSMALNVDLAPTALALSALPVPKEYQGRNLLPAMQDPEKKIRDGFYYEFYGMPQVFPCEGYRTEDWKLTRYHDGGRPAFSWDSLYHLKTDPYELQDLALDDKHQNQLAIMVAAMNKEKSALAPPGHPVNKPPIPAVEGPHEEEEDEIE